MIRGILVRLFLVILFSTLVFGIGGCGDFFSFSTLREKEVERVPAVTKSYQFEDIPLPPGMKLNREESFIYETKATKTGLLVYEGKGDMGLLARFFKEQMPNYQWRLVSNFEIHNIMLTFVKEGWTSIISIIPKEDETKRVEIRVGPIDMKVFLSSK